MRHGQRASAGLAQARLRRRIGRQCAWAALSLAAIAAARASGDQTPPPQAEPSISVETTAELIKPVSANGRTVPKLLPADHVVAGDIVVYSLRIHNNGPGGARAYAFSSPIPEHMAYVEGSALAPGASVTYSIDGGKHFDRPANLTVHGAEGKQRPAVAADYTHIRWVLRNELKPGSMALARFRARVVG